jgi:tRNA A37 N6-isopentenylltransferase MiaA
LESPDSDFNEKEFHHEASAAVAGVLSSGYLPVVVGSVIAATDLVITADTMYRQWKLSYVHSNIEITRSSF